MAHLSEKDVSRLTTVSSNMLKKLQSDLSALDDRVAVAKTKHEELLRKAEAKLKAST